jgi:hypothetical protein
MALYFSLKLSGQYTVVVIIWGHPILIGRSSHTSGLSDDEILAGGNFFRVNSTRSSSDSTHPMTSVCVTRSSSRVQTRVQLDSTATLLWSWSSWTNSCISAPRELPSRIPHRFIPAALTHLGVPPLLLSLIFLLHPPPLSYVNLQLTYTITYR